MRRTLLILMLPVMLAACGTPTVPELKAENSGGTLPTSTTSPNFANVTLPFTSGNTTTTGFTGEGNATISGTVTGPKGAVKQATVLVERLDGGQQTFTTNDDGNWEVGNLLGGRYRVRAWKAPKLSSTEPQVFFLELNGNKDVDLQLSEYKGENATFAIAPDPPIQDQEANIAIRITNQGVGGSGVVESSGLGGQDVTLAVAGQFTIVGDSTQTTDANGQATFRVRCYERSPSSVTFFVKGAAPLVHKFPSCAPPLTVTKGKTTTTR